MSRHRNVRALNYEEEYEGYDDVYGHSVEDDYCVSPGTASQFMYDRSGQIPSLSSFMQNEQIPEEEEGSEEETDPLQDSSTYQRPKLTDLQEAQLNSCLEQIRSVLGDSTPDHVLVDAVIKQSFDYEKALDAILSQQEAPKPQRQPRNNRRSRTGGGGANWNVKKDVKLKNPPPPKTAVAQADTGVTADPSLAPTRMTFTSNTKTASGFTPEKNPENGDIMDPEKAAIEAVKRDLNLDDADCVPKPEEEGATGGIPGDNEDIFSTPKKEPPEVSAGSIHKSASKSKLFRVDTKKEYETRKAEGKDFINLVVIGHVDAGKSTLMGHVLYQLGAVNKKTMHKYETESKKLGKASFAYAWVLDETEEERSRGVTMDVAQTWFETPSRIVHLLDAPGHKDFIPNMITGAAQADAAILVVNATRGEFETGFDAGGQTREHAMLIRSLGVSQMSVAINKMDTVDWSQERYNEIVKKLGQFLKQAGFKESEMSYIPCSGLSGENLTQKAKEPKLSAWYSGTTLVEKIDTFKSPERPIDKPFRMCITDVFKGMGSGGVSVVGTIHAGSVCAGDRLLVMPQAESCMVKGVQIDEATVPCAFAGDTTNVIITGVDMANIGVGNILCDPANPIPSATRIQARVVIFNIDVPVTKGFPVEFHYQSLTEPAHIKKLISQLHKSSGEVVRKKPRCLTKNTNAVIELEINRAICIELYKDYKDLGRFMLRSNGHTIAAGLVTEIKDSKAARGDN